MGLAMIKQGTQVVIDLETKESPYRYHGEFISQDDEFIKIKGSVGGSTGHIIYIPKSRIKSITEYN